MQEKLFIEGTEDTPMVILDSLNNIYEIKGKSIPENAKLFYFEIINWLNDNLPSIESEIVLNLKFEYLNSASSMKVIEIILLLEKSISSGCKVKIIWFYKKGDTIMKNKGKELSSILEIPFEISEMS